MGIHLLPPLFKLVITPSSGITVLRPTGDGDLTQIPVPAGPPHWTRVLSQDGVVVEQPQNYGEAWDLYTLPPSQIPPSAVIDFVSWNYFFKSDSGPGGFCGCYRATKIAGVTRWNGPDFTPTTSWANYEKKVDGSNDPAPPGGWTVDVINSMQAGVKLFNAGLGGRGYLDEWYLKVYWHVP